MNLSMHPDRHPQPSAQSVRVDDAFELPVMFNGPGNGHILPERHIGFPCFRCQMADYPGRRHSCFFCKDFHLCDTCFTGQSNMPVLPHHKYFHIMQVFYTRTAYELYFGGEPYTTSLDWQSFTCALCLRAGFNIQTLYQHLLEMHREHPDHKDYLMMAYSFYFVDRSSRNEPPPPPGNSGFAELDQFQIYQDLPPSAPIATADPPISDCEAIPNAAAAAAEVPIIRLEIEGMAPAAAPRNASRAAASYTSIHTGPVRGPVSGSVAMYYASRELQDVKDLLMGLNRNSDGYQARCMGLLMRARGIREQYSHLNTTSVFGSHIDRISRQIEREALARLQVRVSTSEISSRIMRMAAEIRAMRAGRPVQEPAPPASRRRNADVQLFDRLVSSGIHIDPSMSLLINSELSQRARAAGSLSERPVNYDALNRNANSCITHPAGGLHGHLSGVLNKVQTNTQTGVAVPVPIPPNTGTATTELATATEPVPKENPINQLDLSDGRFLCSKLKERFETMPGNAEEEKMVSKACFVDAVLCSLLSEKDLTSVPLNLHSMLEMGSNATATVAANESEPLVEPLIGGCTVEEGLNQVPRLMHLTQKVIQARLCEVDPMIKYFKALEGYRSWSCRLTFLLEAKKGPKGIEAKKGSKKTEAKKGSNESEAQPTSGNRYLEDILQINSPGNYGQDGDILGAGINDGLNDPNPIAFIDGNDGYGDGEEDESNDDDSNDSKFGNDCANDDNANGNVTINTDDNNNYPYPLVAPVIIDNVEVSGSETSGSVMSVEEHTEDEDMYDDYEYDLRYWEL